jgi:hypothetical protein
MKNQPMRIIKLVTPHGEVINVEMSTNERELKELLSLIAGVQPSEVKGIRDKFGNFYTISFAVNNYIINSSFSDTYFLICDVRQLNNFDNSNVSHSMMNTYHYNPSSYSNPQHFNPINNPYKTNHLYNTPNVNISTGIPNNNMFPTANNYYPPHSLKNETNFTNENFDPKVKNNQKLINMYSENYIELSSPITTISYDIEQEAFTDRCMAVVKELSSKGHLDDKLFKKIKESILSGNEATNTLFKVYLQRLITKEKFINSLSKLLCDDVKEKPVISHKNKILKILEQLDTVYDDPTDMSLLKNLVEYDNEFILGTFEVYEEDNDMENLIDSIKRLLNKYKKRTPFQDSVKTIPAERKSLRNESPPMLQKYVSVGDIQPEFGKPECFKPFTFDSDVENYIYNNLHTEHKIIFRHIFTNNTAEAQVFKKHYEYFGKTDILLKSVKVYTKNFIQNIISDLNETEKGKFDLLTNERNTELLSIFKSFKEHNSFEKLGKEICEFIKTPSFKMAVGSSSSDNEESSFILTKRKFSKLFRALNLNRNEKAFIEELIRSEHRSIQDILGELEHTNDINAILIKVERLLSERYNKDTIPKESNIDKIIPNSKFENISPNTIISEISNTSPFQLRMYNTFNEILFDLETFNKITSAQHKFFERQYESNNHAVHSVWQVYVSNNNLNDLVEILNIFYNFRDVLEKSKITATPVFYYHDKADAKSCTSYDQTDAIKTGQIHIIDMLVAAGMLNQNCANVINQLIKNDNGLVNSSFEFFANTKDYKDFCETLTLMVVDSWKLRPIDVKDSNDSIGYIENIVNMFDFKSDEREVIYNKYSQKDEFLLSSLEFYENTKDRDELLDNLLMIVGT